MLANCQKDGGEVRQPILMSGHILKRVKRSKRDGGEIF